MTSADSISLILRRLDEIERKLDRIMEEPGSYGHRLFGTQGQFSKEGLSPSRPSPASLGPDDGRANNVRHPELSYKPLCVRHTEDRDAVRQRRFHVP